MQSKGCTIDQREIDAKIQVESTQKMKVVPFVERWTDSVAYKGVACIQNGSPRVHLIIGKLHAR